MLQQLIEPLPLALVVIVAGAVLLARGWRTVGAGLVALAVVGVYLLATPGVSDALVAGLERRHPPKAIAALPPADAIVVLGGGVAPTAPPRAWPNLSHAADRLWHGARLYRAGKAPLVMTTGARPYADAGQTAAEAARQLMADLGVPAEAVMVRDDATSTREDAVTVRAAMVEAGVDDILLVTSALHMPRALATFRAQDIEATPAPTDHEAVDAAHNGLWPWLPDSGALWRSHRAWHEYLGLFYYRLRGWI